MIGFRWASLAIGVLAFVAAAYHLGHDGRMAALFGSIGLLMAFWQAPIWWLWKRYGRDESGTE